MQIISPPNRTKQYWALALTAGAVITLGISSTNFTTRLTLWGIRTLALASLFRVFVTEPKRAKQTPKALSQGDSTETIEQQKQAIAHLQQQLNQVERYYQEKIAQIQQSAQLQENRYQQQWQRFEAQAVQLETERRRLQAERNQMLTWAEGQSEQISKQQSTAEETLEARRAELEAQLETQRNQILESVRQQWAEQQEKVQKEIEARDKLITDLERRIGELMLHAHSLQMPDLTEGMTTEELQADRVIRYLYEHGVIAKKPQVKYLGQYKFEMSFEVLAIAPGAQEKNDKIKWATSLLDAFKRIQDKLADGIPGVVPGCKTRPSVDIRNQRIALKVDTSGIDWAEQARAAEKPVITEADPNWLLELAEIGNHFRITGPTDSGKSALADNLVGALRQLFEQLSLTTADPKYPFTEWTTFIPQYKGIEECFASVFKLEKLITSRFAKARLKADLGEPLPEFEPELFALDEAEILMDEARGIDDANPPKRGEVKLQKQLTRALRKGLKLGRGLTKKKGKGLKVLYIAQSPLCSRLGFHRDDFDQSVNLFIGENIPRALMEELKGKITSDQRDYWLEQYHLRVERGDRYFCLVKVPASAGKKSLFMATMPPPGTYTPEGIVLTDLAEPEDLKNFDVLKYLAEAEAEVVDDEGDEAEDDDEDPTPDLERNRLEFAYQLESQPTNFSGLPAHGLDLLGYIYGRGSRLVDEEGWFTVAKLRDNWGKHQGLNTETLKALLRELNTQGAGEFRCELENEWRPRISPDFLPNLQM